jgi:hypothetical protein
MDDRTILDHRTYAQRTRGSDKDIPMHAPKRAGYTKVKVLRRAKAVGITVEDMGHVLDYRGVQYSPSQYKRLYNMLNKR